MAFQSRKESLAERRVRTGVISKEKRERGDFG